MRPPASVNKLHRRVTMGADLKWCLLGGKAEEMRSAQCCSRNFGLGIHWGHQTVGEI
jgi:hypothetical protein